MVFNTWRVTWRFLKSLSCSVYFRSTRVFLSMTHVIIITKKTSIVCFSLEELLIFIFLDFSIKIKKIQRIPKDGWGCSQKGGWVGGGEKSKGPTHLSRPQQSSLQREFANSGSLLVMSKCCCSQLKDLASFCLDVISIETKTIEIDDVTARNIVIGLWPNQPHFITNSSPKPKLHPHIITINEGKWIQLKGLKETAMNGIKMYWGGLDKIENLSI